MNKKFSIVLAGMFLLGMLAAPLAVQARSLSVNDRKRIQCAKYKAYVLADLFDATKPIAGREYTLPDACVNQEGKKIIPPDWFAEELARMDKHKFLYVKGETTLSEADVWRQAFAVIYEYLDMVDTSLDPSKPVVMEQLSRFFVGNRLKFMLALDRLNKDLLAGNQLISMKDSMGGRARSMLATLELINSEFFSTVEAFSSPISQREDKYRKAALATVILTNHLLTELRRTPIPTTVPDAKVYQTTRTDRALNLLLLLLGSAIAGFSAFLLLQNYHENILRVLHDYKEKSSVWAENFNRQFLTIDVKYIVFGTIGLAGLFGLFLGVMAGGFLGVFIFLLILSLGAVVSVRMPMAVLDALKKSRGKKVNAQLMDSLILLSNSLRSGMDIVQGFEMVSKDMLPPIADEFGLVVKNYQLGTPFEKALDGLSDRVESRMLAYIIKAIIIQRQVGGNLTVIFSRLVENIREESKLEEKLQAMTAQQKIQSIVVSIMPFVMMLVMFIFNPSQMIGFYTSPLGIVVFVFCLIWIGIGLKVLKKMGEVRV